MIQLLAQEMRVIENFGGTAWSNQTQLHPLGLALTIVGGLALLAVPRRYAMWPFIILACMVAPAQRLVIGGLDFNLMRLMVVFGFLRIVLHNELRGVRWLALDYVILAFAAVRTLAYTVQHASTPALIFQAGQTFDAVGLYFLFRCLVRGWADVTRTTIGFIIMSLPVAFAFVVENRTGRNAFAFFGGVPEITLMREGRLRCQGAFAHPIIAGCFWASMLPLSAALWWQGIASRIWAIMGCAAFTLIVFLTASSTPVMGVIFGVIGGAMFFVRWWMRYICFGVLLLLFGLHLSMKAPVWNLVARITIAKGNTGWHRFMLIDSAIKRFDEWALVGTKSTAHWFWGGQDVTNHYVLEAVRGGVVTLLLFIATIWLCFRAIGRTWRAWHAQPSKVVLSWALGVCLFVHCTNFIGVSYFGQGVFAWFLILAMIASMDEITRDSRLRSGAPVRRSTSAPGGGRILINAVGGAALLTQSLSRPR